MQLGGAPAPRNIAKGDRFHNLKNKKSDTYIRNKTKVALIVLCKVLISKA